jgi:glycosyltransferase involved in cell wall biosynthesis
MNMTSGPLLSVVMPVHNARPFLDESIRSILAQTFDDFEFVILDDASTDGSPDVVCDWARRDGRIVLHRSPRRLGLAGSSNAVVARAQAPIVARMDADDVAHPDRLRRQWHVITGSRDVVVVGTLCDGIDARGRVVRPRDRWRLVRKSAYIPFPHGSVMFRREAFDDIGGYDETLGRGEDQDLCARLTARGRVLTLPDALYSYRYHSQNATLLNGARAVAEEHAHHEHVLAAFYMLGAMRLWAGDSPGLLRQVLEKHTLRWNCRSLMILASAFWGQLSPPTLRAFLRSSIRARDLVAGFRVKDGTSYEWRSE